MSVANNTQHEMQEIIRQCLNNQTYDTLKQCLHLYEQTFGKDSFYCEITNLYNLNGPLVSLICMNVTDETINNFLCSQNYKNIEVVNVGPDDTFKDICDYFSQTSSSYICFLEPQQLFDPDALSLMVQAMNAYQSDMVISARNFVNPDNTIIIHPDLYYQDALKGQVFNGKSFLSHCFNVNTNLFGILSTLMVSTAYAKSIDWQFPNCCYDEIQKFAMLSQFIVHGAFGYIDTPLISTLVSSYHDDAAIQEAFYQYVQNMCDSGLLTIDTNILYQTPKELPSLAKHITFFYTDKGEYYNVKPIADEAQKRGYEVTFTTDLSEEADIGVYCQHACFQANSKFSLILLHDMGQTSNLWPNMWERERWNQFDLGILPGEGWSERWRESACCQFANPRLGTFCLGYPKNDIVSSPEVIERAQTLKNQFQFKHDFTVLYAPSWENDEKEDDFIRALVSLPINLIIKQADWPDTHPHIIENIRQMRIMHEGKYENVYYIEPGESIMTALELCDLVVSETSNVMVEAGLFNKPSIAVYDWLIPDTVPSRLAAYSLGEVISCKKVELREYVEKLSTQPDFYADAQKLFKNSFSNAGHCCSDIVDAIDYYTQGIKESCSFMDKKLSSKYALCRMWN